MNYNRKRDQLIKEASEPGISNERMQEIRNEMEKEVDKLNNNKTIADFMEAMQAFNDMMDQVNAIVASYINPSEEGGCSGNCGSCGGCH
ncbi:MAG: YlbF family regulator [Clostridia bacterium]|nr:YlbF family regulator [Clostridia bacterium]